MCACVSLEGSLCGVYDCEETRCAFVIFAWVSVCVCMRDRGEDKERKVVYLWFSMWERGCESVRFGDGGRALKKKICFSGVVTVDVRVCGWQKRVGLLYLCVGVIFPPSCAKKKGRHCKLCKWVCVYLRDMWGYVCVGVRASACVCVCMCVCATRIHKLPSLSWRAAREPLLTLS